MVSANFQTEMDRKRGSLPELKIEFIKTSGVAEDISSYYLEGANFEQIKERAPDEIQAGNFDIVCANHDDNFSEFIGSSLLNGIQYHGAKIKVSMGFTLPDGTKEYTTQAIGIIDELSMEPGKSRVIFRCRDRIGYILDRRLHERPSAESPIKGSGNVGNGNISTIGTKPFKTVDEDWTVTCTTGGGDGTAQFSVVGSISGNAGTATSGTEFSTGDGVGGLKFTITAGSFEWLENDSFTFSTRQYPEWAGVNPVKILWEVLTGYDWDTNTQQGWSDFVLDLDNTQSSANTDLDYDAFVEAIASVSPLQITGYIAYDEEAVSFMQGIILLILGSFYTNTDGDLAAQAFKPKFAQTAAKAFTDETKITDLSYRKTIDEIINYIVVKYKATDSWDFSEDTVNFNGVYVASDSASIAKYGRLSEQFEVRWFSPNAVATKDFSDKLIERYGEPPLNIDFKTGLDGLLVNIGDIITVTDTKYGFSAKKGEASKIIKNFDRRPMGIDIRLRQDELINTDWGFLGSSGGEGDNLSPQASNFDSASSSDLDFCYLSQTGGGTPDYRMF